MKTLYSKKLGQMINICDKFIQHCQQLYKQRQIRDSFEEFLLWQAEQSIMQK